ncbi:uncharacterized protein LOC119350425 [Triticum dicoccoides]|uniref:uncharacterized protein LOC119350425 n=1 Tax=Triticum dicoccoides TaxID=85692 RepID=UPI00188E5012|nr:uncharacterized protein LOC119350425 [Triticum dicoccoides]
MSHHQNSELLGDSGCCLMRNQKWVAVVGLGRRRCNPDCICHSRLSLVLVAASGSVGVARVALEVVHVCLHATRGVVPKLCRRHPRGGGGYKSQVGSPRRVTTTRCRRQRVAGHVGREGRSSRRGDVASEWQRSSGCRAVAEVVGVQGGGGGGQGWSMEVEVIGVEGGGGGDQGGACGGCRRRRRSSGLGPSVGGIGGRPPRAHPLPLLPTFHGHTIGGRGAAHLSCHLTIPPSSLRGAPPTRAGAQPSHLLRPGSPSANTPPSSVDPWRHHLRLAPPPTTAVVPQPIPPAAPPFPVGHPTAPHRPPDPAAPPKKLDPRHRIRMPRPQARPAAPDPAAATAAMPAFCAGAPTAWGRVGTHHTSLLHHAEDVKEWLALTPLPIMAACDSSRFILRRINGAAVHLHTGGTFPEPQIRPPPPWFVVDADDHW